MTSSERQNVTVVFIAKQIIVNRKSLGYTPFGIYFQQRSTHVELQCSEHH